ncbi:Rho family GTPase [Histomonas meleagridis]|uniref:Rho family GTPase n=1 Tax=Histomonas meleagridis TaxID=135588 RepID=UPI00355AB7A7|nr:Rho family GTPase [Histomonas meleagridis]KAH0806348.1 Rho family GTPase [Histomonas meleagridis]
MDLAAEEEFSRTSIKLTFVGPRHVGKSTFVTALQTAQFVPNLPPVVEKYFIEYQYKEVEYNLYIWDTPSDNEPLRVQMYPFTNVFLLCFSVVDTNSFNDALQNWVPALQSYPHNFEKIIIAVGMQEDLRQEFGDQAVSTKNAKKAFKSKGIKYIECSSYQPNTLHKVIRKALDVLNKDDESSSSSSDSNGHHHHHAGGGGNVSYSGGDTFVCAPIIVDATPPPPPMPPQHQTTTTTSGGFGTSGGGGENINGGGDCCDCNCNGCGGCNCNGCGDCKCECCSCCSCCSGCCSSCCSCGSCDCGGCDCDCGGCDCGGCDCGGGCDLS